MDSRFSINSDQFYAEELVKSYINNDVKELARIRSRLVRGLAMHDKYADPKPKWYKITEIIIIVFTVLIIALGVIEIVIPLASIIAVLCAAAVFLLINQYGIVYTSAVSLKEYNKLSEISRDSISTVVLAGYGSKQVLNTHPALEFEIVALQDALCITNT